MSILDTLQKMYINVCVYIYKCNDESKEWKYIL